MVFKKRFWRNKRVAKKKKSVRKRPSSKQLVTKSQLYRAIRRNVETKMASVQYSFTLFNSKITSTADFLGLLPQITTGLEQNNRIGNAIRPIKLVIKGYICYSADQASGAAYQDARMLGARLFCFSDKSSRAYQNNIYNTQLLDAGGSSQDFNGTPMDWILPHNKDQYTFYADKRFKILKPFGWTNTGTPSSTGTITSFNNSVFHPFTIVLTQKQMPAVFHYDQIDSSNYPTNFAPFLALGYCDLLNKAADTTATQIGMEYRTTLYYEDA